MKIIKRSIFLRARFAFAAFAFIHPLEAQQSRLAPAAIGQIANEVLRALVPPGESLSRVPVAKRKIFFDQERTLAAFGYVGAPMSLADLGIQTAVITGSKSLLNDCDQWGTKACQQLGWSGYVWIEPISITPSEAVVRGYVSWPERRTPFVPGSSPRGKAYLASFATEIHLARSASGEWKLVKKGVTSVGE